MANNKSVKILRGTNAKIYEHGSETLENGQLLFNTDKGYITVGKNSNTTMNSLPVTVREVKGLFSDTSAISDFTTGDNYYINDDNGQRLKIFSSKGIQLNGTTSITLNGTSITLNVAPEISEPIAAAANNNKAVTSAWVRTAIPTMAVAPRAGLGNKATLDDVLKYISDVFLGTEKVTKISAGTLNVDK